MQTALPRTAAIINGPSISLPQVRLSALVVSKEVRASGLEPDVNYLIDM